MLLLADKASVSRGVDAEGQDNASHRGEEEEETDEEGQEKEEEEMEEEEEEKKEQQEEEEEEMEEEEEEKKEQQEEEEEEMEEEESGAGTTKENSARYGCSVQDWVGNRSLHRIILICHMLMYQF